MRRSTPEVPDKERVPSGVREGRTVRPGCRRGRVGGAGEEGVPERGRDFSPRGPSRGASHLRGVAEAGAGVRRDLGDLWESRAGRGVRAGRGAALGQSPGADRADGADRGEQQQHGTQCPGQQVTGVARGRGRPRGLGVRNGVRGRGHGRRRAATAKAQGSALYTESGTPPPPLSGAEWVRDLGAPPQSP